MTKDWHTFREIEAQPDIWASWGHAFAEQAATIQSWIAERGITRVWFTGAGTSAFIGDTIADALSARLPQVTFRSVATTDLVASPETYLTGAGKDLLVVSFGRSGNSSETVGTLKLLDRRAPAAHRLNVICNAGSALSTGTHRGPGTQATVVLPDACHDKGFAMTSSFTTMLLTALACFLPADEVLDRTTALSKAARAALQRPVETPNVSPCGVSRLGSVQGDRTGKRPEGSGTHRRTRCDLVGQCAWVPPRTNGGDDRKQPGGDLPVKREPNRTV